MINLDKEIDRPKLTNKKSIRKKATISKKSELPIISCPCCDNDSLPVEIILHACEKCAEVYSVPIELLLNNVNFTKSDTIKIKNYLKDYYNRKQYLDKKNSISNYNEDDAEKFNVAFKNEPLTIIKEIKKFFKFPSLVHVIHYVFEGFLTIFKEMRKLPGDKIYLVDNLNNKSKEIKKEFLTNTYKAFNEEQDKYQVEQYLNKIDISYRVSEIKKESSLLFTDDNDRENN
jgi:hypothetical protein